MKNDYSRHVVLLCPVCGNSQFEAISDQFFSCSDCKNEFDKDSLISQNSESSEAMIDELKKELIADIDKDFKKMFKRLR
ncbi:ECs_2282 family putative zinc-binding protein [Aeromonas veronii]|uniref:ECs_2282 family putative zinc-binding protein n=1 Tax=Aeromonas veronii TaxID=654 RepID=UPI001F3AA453|nr:hypothetical protein [Aeromonas veronii]MCF5857686.1 hypothetical protein [Aeromonas veronii]